MDARHGDPGGGKMPARRLLPSALGVGEQMPLAIQTPSHGEEGPRPRVTMTWRLYDDGPLSSRQDALCVFLGIRFIVWTTRPTDFCSKRTPAGYTREGVQHAPGYTPPPTPPTTIPIIAICPGGRRLKPSTRSLPPASPLHSRPTAAGRVRPLARRFTIRSDVHPALRGRISPSLSRSEPPARRSADLSLPVAAAAPVSTPARQGHGSASESGRSSESGRVSVGRGVSVGGVAVRSLLGHGQSLLGTESEACRGLARSQSRTAAAASAARPRPTW
jgi:hypothetical protein